MFGLDLEQITATCKTNGCASKIFNGSFVPEPFAEATSMYSTISCTLVGCLFLLLFLVKRENSIRAIIYIRHQIDQIAATRSHHNQNAL
jgi:hypothetical protein